MTYEEEMKELESGLLMALESQKRLGIERKPYEDEYDEEERHEIWIKHLEEKKMYAENNGPITLDECCQILGGDVTPDAFKIVTEGGKLNKTTGQIRTELKAYAKSLITVESVSEVVAFARIELSETEHFINQNQGLDKIAAAIDLLEKLTCADVETE